MCLSEVVIRVGQLRVWAVCLWGGWLSSGGSLSVGRLGGVNLLEFGRVMGQTSATSSGLEQR